MSNVNVGTHQAASDEVIKWCEKERKLKAVMLYHQHRNHPTDEIKARSLTLEKYFYCRIVVVTT
ncbi:CLUMA_CG021115, isoform A [Clunio marinus]|uniref:CLUMA_CG021115, isoform A n=1 Tax=Clunio marinus TaxID=568069 RepID=A0A1J1J685_9DIPT|nr:CLUMA_CG021115, isoform A [Clunio marinus]